MCSVYVKSFVILQILKISGSNSNHFPGKQPKTRSEIASVIESGHEVIFYQEDLTNVYKQGIPIVNIYNSRDHYYPTSTLPPAEQNIWKIKQAAHYLDSSVELFSETDKNSLNTQEKNVIKALETDIKHFKSVFKVETPCIVKTRTLTKSVGGSFSGPIHPLPGSVPSEFSSLNLQRNMPRNTHVRFVVKCCTN